MKIIITITAILFYNILYSQTTDAHWIYVGKTDKGITCYIRSEVKYRSENNDIVIWTKYIHKKIKYLGKIYYNATQTSLERFNCGYNESNVFEYVLYDSNGDIIDSFDDPNAQYKDIIPETFGELMIKKVCEIYNNKK